MQRIDFSIHIRAPRETVWKILWDDATYRDWTSAFAEGSYAETDWQEGGEIRFLSPDGSGLVSTIAVKRPPEYMSFEHLGVIKDGKEDRESPEVQAWKGAQENYTLTEAGGGTDLLVEIDLDEKEIPQFQEMWPRALERVKKLAEA